MNIRKYLIPNISCAHCAHTIKQTLSQIQGVEDIEISIENKEVSIEFTDATSEESIIIALQKVNYPPLK